MVAFEVDDWEEFREEANEWALRMQENFILAKEAFDKGDGYMAKQYSEEGKYCRKRMESANKSAADAIFDVHNEDRSTDVIDLHGLYKAEAIAKVTERINYAVSEGISHLTVIVGQGHHSDTGPKLKPCIVEFASKNYIPVSFPGNSGRIYLNLRRLITNNYSDIDSDRSSYNENSSESLSSPFTTYQGSSSFPTCTIRPRINNYQQTSESIFPFVCMCLVIVCMMIYKLFY